MFFNQISQVMQEGVNIHMTLSIRGGNLAVLVSQQVADLKDAAKANLVPFTVSGTPDDLDRGFIPALAQPLQKTAGLLTNMAEYERQADKAAADSKGAKAQKEKESKEVKEKKEKYDKHMKKADDLEAAGDIEAAILSLQQAKLHATEKDQKKVDDKIVALKAQQSQGSLFEMPPTDKPKAEVPKEAVQAPTQPEPQPAQAIPPQQPQPQGAMPGSNGQPYNGQGYPGGYPPQYPYPGNGYPGQPMGGQGYNGQQVQGGFQPNGGFVPGGHPGGYANQQGYPPYGAYPHEHQAIYREEDYAGMPDVHATHVGEMAQQAQQ